MAKIDAGAVKLEYESFGEGELILLVMGVGAQMIYWPEPFCQRLAERGYRVVRFDNRDIGLSTRLSHLGVPNVRRAVLRALVGLSIDPPYTLGDMGDDVANLAEALGHPRAHVIGASMGGMVAQVAAHRHPERIASLTSIMSSPGGRRYMGKVKAIMALLKPAGPTEEEVVERVVSILKATRGTGFPFDEEAARTFGRQVFQRGAHPEGFARQLVAILAAGDRTRQLQEVQVPTLVLHGSEDPLVPPRAGRATAKAIPAAQYHEIPGMGHELPPGAWDPLLEQIVAHVQRHPAEARSGSGVGTQG